MKIISSEFIASYPSYSKCPGPTMPEYAFVGRSNVGKSSLINMLLEKKQLAKTSQTPGKTQLINHFIINSNWYLVDLPGYGFAKLAKTKRKEFSKLIRDYAELRENLVCLFVLIDSRHKPQPNDLQFMQWLGEKQIPFAMVFTKTDKLSKKELIENVDNYKTTMLEQWNSLPEIFITSSELKTGREEILSYIDRLNNSVEF